MSLSYALAVDMGGTKVEAALVDPAGVVLASSRFRAPTGADRDSDQLAISVDEVVALAGAALPTGATLVGAGIGSAGPVNEVEGRVSPSISGSGETIRCATKWQPHFPTSPSFCEWTASASRSRNTGWVPVAAMTT